MMGNLHQDTTNAAQPFCRARLVEVGHTIRRGPTITLGVGGRRKVEVARGESGGRARLPWAREWFWHALGDALALGVGDTIAGHGASHEEEDE